VESVYVETHHLTAGECGPEQQMPLTLVEARAIEAATHHADSWNVGFRSLSDQGLTWVLSRIALEMTGYPSIDEDYSVITWVESVNRHMSFRNFEFRNASGHTIGYGRSVWVAIDIESRNMGDLSPFAHMAGLTANLECPIKPVGRHRPIDHPSRASIYDFRYCDLDFNRHVNSVRYLEAIFNQWPQDFHSRFEPWRLEITYLHETYLDKDVLINIDDRDPELVLCDIVVGDSINCHAALSFRQRKL